MRLPVPGSALLSLIGPVLAHAAAPPEADRAAILAMQGEYAVSFQFRETVVLAAGYERKSSKDSGARELVLVVEDEPGRIVLQHLLVGRGGHVTKHWRQDWHWQAPSRFEYSAEQTWRVVPLSAEQTTGQWTQCVFEVSDAPRYCGTGAWNHKYGSATWTSDRSWRPLPRREYTTRADYNALNVENRHTITPQGWTHEQDNTKVLRDGERTVLTLVRETGFNDYRRTSDTDFEPARRYWSATAPYWARVRDHWQQALDQGGLQLTTAIDGMPVIVGLFGLATDAEAGKPVAEADITAVFRQYVVPVTETGPAPWRAASR